MEKVAFPILLLAGGSTDALRGRGTPAFHTTLALPGCPGLLVLPPWFDVLDAPVFSRVCCHDVGLRV